MIPAMRLLLVLLFWSFPIVGYGIVLYALIALSVVMVFR